MKNGFSLLEMIIATALSMLVLVGVISVATSVVRQHFESMAQGELSGDTLISLDQMNKDIENSNALVAPSNGSSGNAIEVYENWSDLAGGSLNSAQPVQVFYYCAQTGNNPVDPSADILWRYAYSGASPIGPPGSCGSSAGGWSGPVSLVYNNFYHESGFGNFFYQTSGGVALHYVVGNPVSTPQYPVPVSYQVDNVIMMQKNYGDTSD